MRTSFGEKWVVAGSRCCLRYTSDGAALGSSEFVREQFIDFRKYLSEHRKSGRRRLRGGDWSGLRVLRDLQKDVITSGVFGENSLAFRFARH